MFRKHIDGALARKFAEEKHTRIIDKIRLAREKAANQSTDDKIKKEKMEKELLAKKPETLHMDLMDQRIAHFTKLIGCSDGWRARA